MANIKISELTELAEIPANTQNLLLVGVDTTPLVPVTRKVRFSTLYDYIDNLGLQAYAQANTATTNAATADQRAVTSGVYANSAFNQANTANTNAVTSGSYANSAFDQANTANTNAVTSGVYANSAYLQANTATTNSATAGVYANNAFDQANTANTNAVTSGSYANSAFNQANTVYLPSVTRLNTTNSGTSSYLFDQYTGNNPDIFIRAGETLSFNLNVTGHPFLIRETAGGTLYNIGLTHVSTTGIVTTDSSAQAQVSGTLYWKVPAELAGNNYVYQCQVHSGMVGNVIIEIPNQANSAAIFANLAFDAANSANVLAQTTFDYANTLGVNVANSLIMVTTEPANNKGAVGDTKGMVFLANVNFYYCTGAYDGTTNIWSKIASTDAW